MYFLIWNLIYQYSFVQMYTLQQIRAKFKNICWFINMYLCQAILSFRFMRAHTRFNFEIVSRTMPTPTNILQIFNTPHETIVLL
jgi:hypothetical protein